MEINLKGKTALVCGSTQGIGRSIALELAASGASVILLARNESALKPMILELANNESITHSFLLADFDVPGSLLEMVEREKNLLSTVDILINNSGGPPGGPITASKPEEFRKTFERHLLANHLLTQAVLEGMKQRQFGRIINIVSTSVKQPIPGLGVSNTIRASVAGWSKTLAGEIAQWGITVNNILPGATKTGRLESIIAAKAEKSGKSVEEVEQAMLSEIPARRFAKPEELAGLAIFLSSDAAAYITGSNIPVDGGRTGCF